MGTGSLLFLASDDAVGDMSVEVRARAVSAIVPLNVPPKEAFVLIEDTRAVLLVPEPRPSDETPAVDSALLRLVLLDVPGAVDAGVWDFDERDEIVESATGASELPEGTRLPLLTDGTCSLRMGGAPDEPGMIEVFLVINCAFEGSLVGLDEKDGTAVFVDGAGTGAGFAVGTLALDPPAPRFQTFATSFFAEERKPKREVCLG